MGERILVTGVSGFIGLHLALEGLKRKYLVRGTLPSEAQTAECRRYLQKPLSKELLANFERVVADLIRPEHWDQAIQGCDAVLHTDSPLMSKDFIHKTQLTISTRRGVKHVFEAAIRQEVDRIIYGSSMAAIMSGHNGFKSHSSDPHEKPNTAYTKNETLAEQDAWNYVSAHARIKLTTLPSGCVLGSIIANSPEISTGLICTMMNGGFSAGVPDWHLPVVDIRDIVSIHFDALKQDKSIGERIILGAQSVRLREIAEIILSAHAELEGKVNTKVLPQWLLKIIAVFNQPMRNIALEANVGRTLPYQKAQDLFSLIPRDARETVRENASDLFRLALAG